MMAFGEQRFAITLTDNPAARAFAVQMPLDMAELNGNEKHANLPNAPPENPGALPPRWLVWACYGPSYF